MIGAVQRESSINLIMFIDLIALGIFVVLRLYSLGGAIYLTYTKPRHTTRSAHLELLLVLFGCHWDWWAFDHLNEEFMSRPWYKRVLRPFGLRNGRNVSLQNGDTLGLEEPSIAMLSVSGILFGKEVFKNRT